MRVEEDRVVMALTRRGRVMWGACLFLLPNLAGFVVFTSLPVLASLVLSFFKWDLFGAPEFVGLQNFRQLLGFRVRDAGAGAWAQWAAPAAAVGLAAAMAWSIRSGTRSARRKSGRRAWQMFGLAAVCAAAAVWLGRVALRAWWPNDPEFWYYAFNTMFLMMVIPLNMAGSLFLAIVLNRRLRGRVVFRTIFFLPSIVAGVGTYLLWRWLYNPDHGLINMIIVNALPGRVNDGIAAASATLGRVLLGRPLDWPPGWLTSVGWAKPALMFMSFWTLVGGYNMVLYLAALQGVSPELYEAADIDGANPWQKLRHVTWPQVSPTTFFILTMSLIGGLQSGFEEAFIMTGGGPAGATTTVSYYIYNHAFTWHNMGYAAAIAWVLFAAVLAVTVLNWRVAGRAVRE
jgi:multiple sugar transport system permease protein